MCIIHRYVRWCRNCVHKFSDQSWEKSLYMCILRYYVCVYAYMRVLRFDYIVMERLRCTYIRYIIIIVIIIIPSSGIRFSVLTEKRIYRRRPQQRRDLPKTLIESRRGTDRNIRTVHLMYSILNIVLFMSFAWRIIGISHAQKQYEQRSEIRHVHQTVIRDPSTPLCTHTVHISS